MTNQVASNVPGLLARALVAIALVGCGGSDPPATPDASAQCTVIGTATGQFTFGAATCDSCMSTSCCDPVTACLTGVVNGARPCADLLGCIAACVVAGGTQSDCVLSCAMQHPAGVAAGITLQNCMQASCATACPAS
jgi:hypothetical protein